MPLDAPYLDAIKGFEGYAPTAQWDYKQNSNGYGTRALYPGETIDRDTAEQRFQQEVAKAKAHVETVAPDAPEGVKAALTSLTYNAGPGWANSGLGELVKAGDWAGAAERFQQYNKAGGEVNPGLVARRAKEAAWFGAAPLGAPQPPSSPPNPRIAPQMPSGAVSPNSMPAYGWTPNNAPTGVPGGSAGSMPQPDMAGMPQMQLGGAPRRPPPDLTQIRALLSRSPAQSPGFRFVRT